MSRRIFYGENLAEFTDLITQRLKDAKEWSYLQVASNDVIPIDIGELSQLLEYEFQSVTPLIALSKEKNQLVMVTRSKAFGNYQTILAQNHDIKKLNLSAYLLNEKGLDYLSQSLENMALPDDAHTKSGIIRMRRRSNLFLVLDDDPMVLKQMEKMLKVFGHTEVFSNAEDFIIAYKKYAPNAIFVDVHLKGARGTNVPVLVQSRIDQFAHTIIISADAQADVIQEAKIKGAKGFIGKPINHEQLCKHVFATPTFVGK